MEIIVDIKKLKFEPEKHANALVYIAPSLAMAMLVNKSPTELPIDIIKAVIIISSAFRMNATKLAPSTKILHTNPKKPILIMAFNN